MTPPDVPLAVRDETRKVDVDALRQFHQEAIKNATPSAQSAPPAPKRGEESPEDKPEVKKALNVVSMVLSHAGPEHKEKDVAKVVEEAKKPESRAVLKEGSGAHASGVDASAPPAAGAHVPAADASAPPAAQREYKAARRLQGVVRGRQERKKDLRGVARAALLSKNVEPDERVAVGAEGLGHGMAMTGQGADQAGAWKTFENVDADTKAASITGGAAGIIGGVGQLGAGLYTARAGFKHAHQKDATRAHKRHGYDAGWAGAEDVAIGGSGIAGGGLAAATLTGTAAAAGPIVATAASGYQALRQGYRAGAAYNQQAALGNLDIMRGEPRNMQDPMAKGGHGAALEQFKTMAGERAESRGDRAALKSGLAAGATVAGGLAIAGKVAVCATCAASLGVASAFTGGAVLLLALGFGGYKLYRWHQGKAKKAERLKQRGVKINGLLMAYEYGSTAEKSQARQILGILKLKEADIFKTQGSGETASHIRLKGAEDLIESRIKTW